MRQYKFLSVIFVILLPFSACRKADDVTSLLKQLDEILDKKEIYEQVFMEKINVLRELLEEQKNPYEIYELNKRLAMEFSSYSMDSTIACLNRNRQIAESLGDREMIVETDIMIAEEYTLAGYHYEADRILYSFDIETIPDSMLYPLYFARYNLACELFAYSSGDKMSDEQYKTCVYYHNLLLEMTESESYNWYILKRKEAIEFGQKEDALNYSIRLMEMSEKWTRRYALTTYLYQEVLKNMYPEEDGTQWLIYSAMSDIICATRDYSSLNDLAEKFFEEGDIFRAFSYTAEHCMPDAIFFGGKLRPWQVSYFFPKIERAYLQEQEEHNRFMTATVIVVSCLVVVLVFLLLLLYKRKQTIEKIRLKLSESHVRIENQNNDLKAVNYNITSLNKKLQEANKVKQAYIVLFLGMMSDNISATRQYKHMILRHIRMGAINEIEDEIKAMSPINEDINEFYKMFDKTFINIFPEFVDKFNSLLVEGEEISPKGDDILTPELRVFALIKMGISDSGKIASLLHYSANTVYNYRAKIKNMAKGNRNEFEDAVRAL